MRPFALLSCLLLGLALFPGTAAAQARPSQGRAPTAATPASRPVSGRVGVQIYVVHATDTESGIDPRLSALSSSFRYFKYKGYRLLSTQDADVSVGEDHSFPIEGGRRLKVTLIDRDDARARVRVEMSGDDGKLLDTTVSINRGGTFIVAGPRYKDGILMLPVRASY
jgi:hypothetical protein